MIAVAPSTIIVNPSVPASNMKEFIAWAKAQGGKATWSTAGNGSTPEFVGEMIKEATGVSFTIVPYRSGGDSVNAVMANNVSATSEASIVVMPKIKGRTAEGDCDDLYQAHQHLSVDPDHGGAGLSDRADRPLGRSLRAARHAASRSFERMNAALQEALKTDEVRDKLIKTGIEPAGGSVADFVAFTKTERQRLSELAAKIKVTKEK